MIKQRGKKDHFSLSNGTKITFEPGQTVLDALQANEIDIASVCGGMGSCGTCRAFIEKGLEYLPPRNEIEIEKARDLNFAVNERQTCQIEAVSGLTIRIP